MFCFLLRWLNFFFFVKGGNLLLLPSGPFLYWSKISKLETGDSLFIFFNRDTDCLCL